MTSAPVSLDGLRITCSMVTLPVANRLPYVKSSVAAFIGQTHPNKMLDVVVNGGDPDARRTLVGYLRSLERDDVRIIELDGDLTLGALRNQAYAHAAGDVVCQWDDDDLHHPERLSMQLAALMRGDFEAAYLQDVMQYVPLARSLYWMNWSATEAKVHPGTLMARRGAAIQYPNEGPACRLGEDLQVALDLNERDRVCRIGGLAHLFIYVSHGANSWADDHHRMLTERLAISRGLLLRREVQIREGLRPFHFDTDQVEVRGVNGTAFAVNSIPISA